MYIYMINEKGDKSNKNAFRPKYKRCCKCRDRISCEAMCIEVCCDEVKEIEVKKAMKLYNEIDDYEAKRSVEIHNRTNYNFKGRRGRI